MEKSLLLRKVRIVTDGEKFAVKKGYIVSQYLDLEDGNYWSSTTPYVEKYCWGSMDQVEKALKINHYYNNNKIRKHWKVDSWMKKILDRLSKK